TEMEEQMQKAGQQAMRQAMKQRIRQWEEEHAVCPSCAAASRRLEGTARRGSATRVGRVEGARRRFRCLACGRRSCPANRLFAPLNGLTITPGLQEAAVLAGGSWPSRVAAHVLKKLSGAQISSEEMRLVTNRHGKQRAPQQQEQAKPPCPEGFQEHPPSASTKQPMLFGLDGGWVCRREQRAGMEGKVAVVCSEMEDLPLPVFDPPFSWSKRGGPRKPPRQRHRLKKRLDAATLGPSREIGQQAKAAAPTLEGEPTRPVVVLGDGAEWIKKEQQRPFPPATCILDGAHFWREVGSALRAAARAKALPEQARDYQLFLQRSRFWLGRIDLALTGWRDLAKGVPAEFLKPIQEAIRDGEHQRPWMGSYEAWKSQGDPVGSGMIERAVSIVINRRMKKRGMRWCRSNATARVALRADLLNEDGNTPQPSRAFP